MNISEIAIRRPQLEHRHVGINAPHIHVVELALRIYTELGFDPTVEHDRLYLNVPRARATWTKGAIERCTGRMAYSDWEQP